VPGEGANSPWGSQGSGYGTGGSGGSELYAPGQDGTSGLLIVEW